MTLAINEAGDVLSDASGAWAPAKLAVNDDTGERLALEGGAWRSVPAPQTMNDTDQSGADATATASMPPSTASEIARGIGLGTRNVAEGLAGSLPGMAVDALTWPGRAAIRALGGHANAPSEMVSEGLTAAGVPEAVTPGERMRSALISGAASTLPTGGAGTLPQAVAQAISGAAAGGASEGTRQLGGGPIAQTAAGMAAALATGGAGAAATAPREAVAAAPQFVSERVAPDVSQLDSRNAIQALIGHDISENPVIPGRAADFGTANQGAEALAKIGSAPDIDTAIAAAGQAAQAPVARPMAEWMQPIGSRPGGIYGGEPDITKGPFELTATDTQSTGGIAANDIGQPLQSVGAAASREGTPADQIAMAPADFAANRLQGEVERLATPPAKNDTTIYIPDTKPTLAEVTGNPQTATDQKYNRQQPEAMAAHVEQENHNAEAVANYYADTAGSAQELQRMDAARSARAQTNIQNVFGDPQSQRAPADPSPTIDLMQSILDNPRQAERDSVTKTLSSLADKFYDANGEPKTDPYALYGIGEHINDLLRGVGDTETSSAARVLKSELTQVKSSLYDDIEKAAPGFAQYRADYQQDSSQINAMQLLQDARLSLLNKDQHITPARWFTFMKGVVQGRADPMDPASSLSDDQMNRLWNITDQLKRSTFIDAGSPRGSPTSMLQEWGKRFGLSAMREVPLVGNLAADALDRGMRYRSVTKETNRVLNPPLGQQGAVP